MRRCASCGKTLADDEFNCKSCGSVESYAVSEKSEENRSNHYDKFSEANQTSRISNIASNNASLYKTPDIKFNFKGCIMGCLTFIGLVIILLLWACGAFK